MISVDTEILLELKIKGAGILIATHDFEEAEVLSDKTILISKGNISGEGSPEAIKAGLGEWILSASIDQSTKGKGIQTQKLSELFKAIPGKDLPEDPRLTEKAKILPFNIDKDKNWHDYLSKNAKEQELHLHSISMRRPTLADAYLYYTSTLK